MMKNSISSNQYALITDAAADLIEMPGNLEKERVSIFVEDIGTIEATVQVVRMSGISANGAR